MLSSDESSYNEFSTQNELINDSLIQIIDRDLNVLSSIIGDLHSWLGNRVNVHSSCFQITNETTYHLMLNCGHTQYQKSPKNTHNYIILLQTMYDKLHVFINLLVEFLNMSPPVSVAFTVPPHVTMLKHPSTSALCKMLWKRVKFLHHHLTEQVLNADLDKSDDISNKQCSQIENISRATQTSLCSLTYCESCNLSTAMIKLLVQTIDTQSTKYNIKDTNVSRARRQVHHEIYNLSEWAAMKCWISAICKDISAVAHALFLTQKRNQYLEDDMKRQRTKTSYDLKINRSKILQLETAVHDTNRRFGEEQSQINQLKKDKEELIKLLEVKEEECLKIEKEKSDCQKTLQKTKEYILMTEKLAEEKSKEVEIKDVKLKEIEIELGRKLITKESALKISEANEAAVSMQLDVLKMEADISKEKKVALEKEVTDLKKKLENGERLLEREFEAKKEIEERLHETLKNSRNIQNEKEKYINEIKKLEAKFEAVVMELKQSKENEQLLLNNPESCPVPQFKLKGDPLTDMEAQRRANKYRIKRLFEQNETLKSTIMKLSKNSSS